MTGLFLAMSIVLTAPALVTAPDDVQKNGWQIDYSKALAEARQQGRLLLVVFR
jgi:hypothetical protein